MEDVAVIVVLLQEVLKQLPLVEQVIPGGLVFLLQLLIGTVFLNGNFSLNSVQVIADQGGDVVYKIPLLLHERTFIKVRELFGVVYLNLSELVVNGEEGLPLTPLGDGEAGRHILLVVKADAGNRMFGVLPRIRQDIDDLLQRLLNRLLGLKY